MTTTTIDADAITLLVTDQPAPASIADTYPVELSDRDEAREALAELGRDGAPALIGVEFDDPEEVDNRIVLRGADLTAVEFIDHDGHRIDADQVLNRLEVLSRVELITAETI